VIVGGNTVRQDDPALTLHGQAGEPPLRVVLSRGLDLPSRAQLWETAIAPTLVFTGPEADPAIACALEQQGVTVVALPDCTPALAARDLARRGCNRVLWECGGTLAAAALQEHCIQEVWAFIAPKLIGASLYGPMGNLGLTRMDEAIALDDLYVETVGRDVLLRGRLATP
jgi:diaminohydroxyphosphoribosylaminopyrimidine deaminase/5-amino-6-(5-phosphoribosylamino)uracil reductase